MIGGGESGMACLLARRIEQTPGYRRRSGISTRVPVSKGAPGIQRYSARDPRSRGGIPTLKRGKK